MLTALHAAACSRRLVNASKATALALLALAPARAGFAQTAPAAVPERPEAQIDRDEIKRLQNSTQRIVLPGGDELMSVAPEAQRQRLEDLRQLLNPVPKEKVQLRVRALQGFLDYDEEDQIVYGPQRTQVEYGKFFLEADSVLMDSRIQEVQAQGNVIVRIEGDEIHADAMRYNLEEGEGVGYNVSGEHKPVYFRSASKPGETGRGDAQMQKVSKTESIFRNTELTACDFKVPHYYLKGREVIFYQNDRVFVRSATLYVRDFPVFYLPVYSRSLQESSPWYFFVGWGSRTGGRLRLGYEYTHRTEEPSLTDDEKYEVRSQGTADIFVDYLSKVGVGAGFDYKYSFDFNRHRGEFALYGLRDDNRQVMGARPEAEPDTFDEGDRGQILLKHYSQITENLNLIVNADWISDPDIYYDVLDVFSPTDSRDHERVPTREARGALTYVREAYVARLMVDIKDRVGIDQYRDTTDPGADNNDWDLTPGSRLGKEDVDGIGRKRWGRASVKAPQFDFATRYLPLGRMPAYYSGEVHLYNSLDKGLNWIDTEDDAFVQGVETYHALMYQYKISQRYILLMKLGFGGGYAARDRDYDVDFPEDDFPQMVDGLEWSDSHSFIAGTQERSLRDVSDGYAYGDAEIALNARFSDALSGKLDWRYRKTTDNYLGDYYRSLGDLAANEDIFPYKLREHWIEGGLVYTLARPLVTFSTDAAYNLESRGEVWTKEPLAYWNNRIGWQNQRGTLQTWVGAGWRQYQYFDPADPRSFAYDVVYQTAGLTYEPIHHRWYTTFSGEMTEVTTQAGFVDSDEDETFFSDTDSRQTARWVYGRELGPKWETRIETRWDDEVGGLREVAWLLQRDLHDAVLVFRVAMEDNSDERDARSRTESSSDRSIDVSVAVKVKMPNQYTEIGNGQVSTLRSRYHEPAVAE